jgi:trans-2,3-dihydro-3-hydroxyanthranilate isomerase
VLLARLDGGAGVRDIVLGEPIGPVVCTVEPSADGGSARFDIPARPERTNIVKDTAALAAALSLAPADLGFDNFVPETWSAGNAFTFVPVLGLAAIGRARPDMAKWPGAFDPDGPTGAFLYCGQTVDPKASFHARMFAPKMGILEDPATGSAAATFAGVLAASGRFADGSHAVAIEQGVEMGRPSLIRLGLVMRGGQFEAASVGGDAVVVSEGMIEA